MRVPGVLLDGPLVLANCLGVAVLAGLDRYHSPLVLHSYRDLAVRLPQATLFVAGRHGPMWAAALVALVTILGSTALVSGKAGLGRLGLAVGVVLAANLALGSVVAACLPCRSVCAGQGFVPPPLCSRVLGPPKPCP